MSLWSVTVWAVHQDTYIPGSKIEKFLAFLTVGVVSLLDAAIQPGRKEARLFKCVLKWLFWAEWVLKRTALLWVQRRNAGPASILKQDDWITHPPPVCRSVTQNFWISLSCSCHHSQITTGLLTCAGVVFPKTGRRPCRTSFKVERLVHNWCPWQIQGLCYLLKQSTRDLL